MKQQFARPDRTVDRFDQNAGQSFTMPATYYFDPAIYEQEHAAVFWANWIYVGHASDVADEGQYLTADILGQQIFVIRNDEGELRSFFNVCLHRGHSLLSGSGLTTSRITCPYHAWAYDRSGQLVGARMSDRMDDFDYDDFALPEVAVEQFCGFVFVNLSADAKPMAEHYPGAAAEVEAMCPDPASLRLASISDFDIAANWKNIGDNLLECYHCHPAHHAFVDLINMDTYRNETMTGWSIQAGTSRAENDVYPVLDGAESFTSLFLWPNLSLGRLPGQRGIFAFSFMPTGPETTLQRLSYYSPDGEQTKTELEAVDYFNNVLGPEDVALVEDVQVGLRSLGYHQGRFICIPDRPEISEHAVHHFHSMVLEALG